MNLKLFSLKALILFFLSSCVLPILSAQEIDEEWIKENYSKKEFMIPMRDGISLFTAVYIPKDNSEKHPILMTRTPYSCAPYGEANMNSFLWKTYMKEYAKEGYILVMQDVRGKWMSEGEFVHVRPFIPNKQDNNDIDEASDAYDTVDWLIKNIKGNNGRVGVCGSSYPGFYSTMAGAGNHPAIKAISPQAPIYDWFIGDDFHHNGAFMLADATGFFTRHGLPRPKPTTQGAKKASIVKGDIYSFYLDAGNIKTITAQMGDSINFWNDMMQHPDYDNWWKERCVQEACKNIQSAVLVVGGLFDTDDLYGTWQTYKSIEQYNTERDVRLIVGPWWHGGWRGKDGSSMGDILFGDNTVLYYQQEVEIPFFNYYLKDKGSITDLSKVTVFFSGENKWRTFNGWPDGQYKPTDIYLHDNKLLKFKKPTIKGSYSKYLSDPKNPVPFMAGELKSRPKEYMVADQRFASERNDVLCFETEILKNDLRLGGPVVVDLQVAVSSTDADFVVKLIDVFPDQLNDDKLYAGKNMEGYQMLVRGEVMRGKYRNSFEKPEPFEIGTPTQVRFELPDVAHVFRKGHKLMIQIQSSWFPLVDRNPQQFTDIYHCDEKDFVRAEIKIFHNKNNASKVILPVLE